jgi:micrococcal nuclease
VRPRPFAAIVPILLATAIVAGCDGRGDDGGQRAPGEATVRTVVDGDTIDVAINGRTERVRLIGVDTPETKEPGKPVDCYGPEASAFTARLAPPGTEVRLVRDIVPRDDYGRLLAYVFRVDDDLFVNDALLRHGYARPLTIAPNSAFRRALAAASSEARANGAGLWAHCDPQS